MSEYSVLIADTSEDFSRMLMDKLGVFSDVTVCTSGMEAARLIHTRSPDVLVLDLLLPDLDGISLLRNMENSGQHPGIVICTDYVSPWILSAAQTLGAACVLQKPCRLEAVEQQVRCLLREPPESGEGELYHRISEMLLQLGFCSKFRGYCYLKEIIYHMAVDPDRQAVRSIYRNTADSFGVTENMVKSSVRRMIRTAWVRRDAALWQRYFGSSGTERLSTAKVIQTLAETVRLCSQGQLPRAVGDR